MQNVLYTQIFRLTLPQTVEILPVFQFLYTSKRSSGKRVQVKIFLNRFAFFPKTITLINTFRMDILLETDW